MNASLEQYAQIEASQEPHVSVGALLNITDAWEMGVCSDVWRLFLIMRSLQCAAAAICSHLQSSAGLLSGEYRRNFLRDYGN